MRGGRGRAGGGPGRSVLDPEIFVMDWKQMGN